MFFFLSTDCGSYIILILFQVVSKHPLEANLAGHSLEKLPKYYFLNYNLIAINLARNFMIVSLRHS